MIELINTGGPITMVPLTMVLIVLVFQVCYLSLRVKGRSSFVGSIALKPIHIRYTGFIALSIGMMGQIMGLYGAFIYIEEQGTIEPNMLYDGFKVSSISMVFGLLLFLISMLFYRILKKD
ncbi:MAG: MotA/TolQ/ExbB proton channel family protein [Bacteroidota bacterium]